VFKFQERDCPVRELIKELVDAAEFLQYHSSEGGIVDRILMNLHTDILAQVALLPRPGSYRELRDMVGLIEERMAVLTERQCSDTGLSSPQRVEKGRRLCDKPSGAAVVSKQSTTCGLSGYRALRRVADSWGPALVAGLSLK
jgi:hypothetical protein